jgi:tol-pal system protein YbgF
MNVWCACAALVVAQAVAAAVPVVESQGSAPRGYERNTAPSPVRDRAPPSAAIAYPSDAAAQAYPANDRALAQTSPTPLASAASDREPTTELFYQLQTLQTEVGELRGLVEEQRHLIERLAREQKEQYLDLDRRMALALKQNGGGAAPVATGGGPRLTEPTESAPSAGSRGVAGVAAPSAGPASASEREAYTRAFNLTRDKRFQEAISGFNQLLVDYPGGEYSANAFYWLGELYLALPKAELEKSRQSFAQVVNAYPAHTKVPDSLYKLGVVYHRLGDNAKALEYLNRAQVEFPSSPAARLAQSYAAEIR